MISIATATVFCVRRVLSVRTFCVCTLLGGVMLVLMMRSHCADAGCGRHGSSITTKTIAPITVMIALNSCPMLKGPSTRPSCASGCVGDRFDKRPQAWSASA